MVCPHISKEVFQLLSSHVKLRLKGKRKQFPLWHKKLALHLNFCGPRAYRLLSSYFTLLSRHSPRGRLSNVKMTLGIIPGIMSFILTRTQSWNKHDCICTLIFDEMVLKKYLSYDKAQDVVLGFRDDGSEWISTIANSAMAVLLTGISRKWVQPVTYTIWHTSTPSSVIRNLLVSLIEQLKGIGITVNAVICDQGASNVSLANQQGVCRAQPLFRRKQWTRILHFRCASFNKNNSQQCAITQASHRKWGCELGTHSKAVLLHTKWDYDWPQN